MKNYIPLQIPSDRTNLYDGPKPVMKYYVGEPEEKKNVADRCEEESRGVVSYIFQLREEGIEYDDIAVLLPKMTNVGSLVEAFKANNIPFVIVGGKDFYKAQEVTDLLNVFRLLTDRTNVIALLGLLRSPFLGCTDQEITDLCHRISPDSDTLLLDELLDSGDSLSKNLARSRRILDDLLLAARVLPVPELWQSVLQTLNVEYILRSQEQGEQKWANVVKLESLCLKYCSSKSCTLAAWLQFIEDAMDSSDETAADLPADRAVRIMTIHKSKGLEFKVVILPYLDRSQGRSDNSYVSFCFEENLFGAKAPNEVKELKNKDAKAFDVLKDKNNQAETAERIRLLYVALTRSKERLYLSGWKNKKKDENSDEVLPGTESLWNMVQYGKKFADTEKTLGEDVFNGGAAGSNCRRMQTRIVDKSEYVVPLTTYFTPSMLQTYLYCQRQYFYTHVCRLPQYKEEGGNSTNDFNTLTAAEQGTLIHSALEYYTGSVDAAWDKAQKTKESQVLNQQGKDLNPAKKLFTDYVNSDLYKSIPEHEREVEFQLPADQGVAFKGVIDCIFPAEDGTYGVVDYKTGSKPQSPDDGYALQLGIYSRAVEMMKHGRVSSMSLHYLQDRGSGVDVKADGDKYQEALHLALEIQGKKREEEFDCTSDNHSCEFCGYAYMCRKETK